MKKLKIVFIILACLMTSFSFFGCDEQIAEIDFRQETIEIRMGEVYNPLENLDYDEEILQYVTFSSGDKTIFYITPNSEIVGVKPGFATLYAYYKNVEMGYCIINVLDNPIQFEGPVGLTYDYQEKNLKWEKVYAQSGGNMILASSYTVEISINDGLPKEYKANDNKYGPLTQAGSYKIRVKTNGGGIYLESDYTKNNLGEYKYLSFVLMAQPLNLSFDNETSVLTWDVNNNPEDTRYKVFVNGENKTGSNGIAENNFILNISEAGTYSVSVEAFNSNIVSFPSRSETLELHTLKSPELSFNNGILSWQTNDKASGFEIVLENDLDEWTYQIAENTYNFSELAGGGYTVKVRALGNQEINSFTSEFSDYQFTKLDSAELVFNSVTGIFAVNNNGFKNIEIVFETNGSQIVKITNNYVFDFTDTKTYSVKARILASDVTKEIDGEFSQFFTLTSDAGQQLTKIKNLSVPILNYGEDQNKSYIGFEIIDENCDYTLLLDNEPLNLNINMNIFNLGLTDDFFIESRIYPFKLIVKKDIMDDTVFINKTSLLNIEKLSAPQTLGLIETSTFSNMQVEVKDDINFNEVVDISILINGVDTNVLNLEQDNFEIIAKFLAKTDHQVINGIRTFYISGETNIFNIQKLETVEDLNFNYSTKKFSWSSVQNAESYKVFINGIEEAEITNTNIQIDLEESYQLTLFAVPEEWISIESGEIGYIFSTINYDVYKVGEIRNLYLEKDDMNNLIKVNWTAPNNIPVDANVYYKVFLNTELISNLITENTFDIEFNLFALAGEYVIKIQIVDNDNEFFPPSNNNANIALIKLSQVNQIERNILEVSARNFNVGTMLGVKFNGVFDGDNTYDLSGLVDGDKLELNISYVGRFNKNLGDYYLDSSPSKFTIYKLNAPTDLNYNDGKFTWGTSDDLYEGFYDYGFYTITNGIKNSGTTTNLEKEITSSEEYEFFVFENASLTWSVITAGGIGFLNSSEVSFKVFKENDIENFKMSYASDEELLLTWDYTENADLNSYIDYEPEFALTIKKGQITIEYLDFKINEVHLNENHYSKTIDISAFESEIDYNISIIVQSSKSLSSEPKEIIITKLNAVNFVEIDGTTLTFLQSETKEISLDGASGIVLSGDIQTNVSEKTYDLSGLVPNTTYAIDMMVLAISPETVLDGHYYINSLVTTFVLTKINDLNPTLVAESNKIEWEQRASADYFNIKVETPSGALCYIENITDTFIYLNNAELNNYIQEVGVYKIYVKAVVEEKIISPNPTASPDLTGFLGNDYEKFAEFEKLEEVQNIQISASPETTQQNVTISWDAVASALNSDAILDYEIWCSNELTGVGELINCVSTTSYTTSTDFSQSGDYFIWIKVKSNGYIESEISNKKRIVKLEAINQFNINASSLVSWNQSTQIASGLLDYSYIFKMFDADSELISTFGDTIQIKNNSYDLSTFEGLKNYGGKFSLKIFVKGNGSSETQSGITTLSSAIYSIDAYKFFVPEINVNGNVLNINSGENSLTYSEKMEYHFTIEKNGEILESIIYQSEYEFPNEWLADEYIITAYITAIEGENNLIKSKTKTENFVKLNTVSGIKAEATDDAQNNVKISWSAVENATGYNIYVNGTFIENAIITATDDICSYETDDLFNLAGVYEIQVQAKASGLISSKLSNVVEVIRLNSINTVYTDAQMKVFWEKASQASSSYTYTLSLINNSGQNKGTVEVLDINVVSSDAFIDNAWLLNLASGNFSVKIIVVGNGSSETSNVLTLTSAEKIINAYKFKVPEISVVGNELKIETSDTGLKNQLKIIYSIKKENQSLINDKEYDTSFIIPSDWEAGEYEISAYVTVKDDNVNLIKSNISKLTIGKLNVATDLKAVATTPDDLTQKSVTLSWTKSTDATSYDIYVNGELKENVITSENTCSYITSTLFSDAGEYIVKVVAKSAGKISSDFSESITIVRLNAIEEAYVDSQAEVFWTSISQGFEYTYSLQLLNNAGIVMHSVSGLDIDIDATSSDAFVNNDWLLNEFVSGNFNVKIIVVGNGSSEISNVLTLTSAEKVVNAYKFVAPTISVVGDELKFETSDTGLKNKLKIIYSIKKENQSLIENEEYDTSFIIPNNWEAGNYEITAYVTAIEGENNLIKSNITKLELEKLDVATDLKAVATDSDDLTQKSVTLSWTKSTDATTYDIYVNNVFEKNVTPDIENNICSYITNTMFNNAGEYIVELIAKDTGKISSNFSDFITIVRLNAIEDACVNSQAEVSWTSISQGAGDLKYTYSLRLVSSSGVEGLVDGLGVNITSSDAFVNNEWLLGLTGGEFNVKVIVVGNGSSETSNVLTLTSAEKVIPVYKFIAPTIKVENDELKIETIDIDLIDKLEIRYTIKLNENLFKEEQVYESPFIIPNDWDAGEYEITAYVTVKDDNVNLIKSNVAELTIEKLGVATDLKAVATNLDDLTQKSVTLSWTKSTDATTYDIYVNNVFEKNVTPDIENNICSYITNTMFNNAGEYIVKLVAKNENKISSDFSSSITIVRLNPVVSGNSNSEMLIDWGQPGQFNNDYTYYLELLRLSGEGYECKGESDSDITETSYAEFADNAWLEGFEGGLFAVGIRVIGNGSSENDLKVATFSSEDFYISILKLYAPVIFTLPEYMEIVNTKTSEEIPSGDLILNIINTNYSIKTGEDFASFAKNAQNNDIDNIVYDGNYFYYPNNWASGEFEFTTFSYPNAGVLNVIPSNKTVKTATRLEAPQGLHFIREIITDFDIYSDDELMEDNEYFSENVFFKYDSGLTSNIYGYKLFIESEFMEVDSNVNLIRGNFETLLSKNPNVLQTLNVIALGGDDNYINSPISSINFTKLKSVERFYASEGIINWTGVENNSAYLVKLADEEHEPIRFWQGSSSITSSYLTGILGDWVSGQIALNIKAIGNVGTDGRDGDGIILDSSYMVDASNNSIEKEFFKLEQPKDFKTYLGYLICNSVGNAMNYRAIITSKEGETLYDEILDNFTARLELASDRFFAGHTEFLYSLETETLYRIQLQAISTEDNIIYSDFSETLNFKVLENANGINDIGLNFAPNGMLDQTRLGAYVSANSYGLLRVDSKGSNYITVVQKTEEPYSERQKLDSITIKLTENSGGKYLSYEFACLGSSEEIKIDDEEGFYYLTSKSTKSDVIYVLETPSIRVENGVIKWDIIEGCDGYYVYISNNNSFNEYNLYKYKGETETYTYPLNYLELPDNYGGDFNNEFFIKIIAVSDNQTILYSYGGEYYYNLNLNGENTSVKINPIKLKKPEIFKIIDGALVFDEGFSGLNDYDEITLKGYDEDILMALFNNFETIQDFKNLQKYLQELLSMPVLTYSQYTGFTFPNIELCFTKVGTSQKYLVTTSSEIFLKMNSIQFENFNDLVDICKVQSEMIISELQSFIAEQAEPEESLLNLLGFYTNFNEFLYSNVLNNILNIYNKEIIGWPSISMLFDEINNEMHQIPSGNYELRIRQLGNSCDWLNSNFKYLFDIHIPRAPGSAEIVEREGNFYLLWNEVLIPSDFNYSPISNKYILYGEDASGNRYEIIRTNGDSSGTENGLQISLTELIEENVLKEHIIKIYMVVAGDNGRVISGLTSRKINISILPVVSPSMDNGILVWNSLVSAKEFEIIARTEGYGEDIFTTENNYWAGEELTAEITYNILVRAIGDIYRDNDEVSYVLTGKTTSIKLSKLNALNVDVNKYGIFEWNRVQNANGFAVYLKDTDLSYIYNDNGLKNTFESLFEGYHTYLFIAMGTTGMIDSDSTVYYLNSRINNDGNGLRAGNLPGITNIRVEDGIIKFNPLGEVETVEQGQSQKVVGYRLMISNGIETLYSTDLPKEVFFTDSQGNMCFDFSIYGNEDTYDISIQPYIYYINPEHTVIKNAQIINDFDGETYQLLLGKASTFEFDKIAAPTSVKILNGQLTWTEIEGCEYVVEVYTITGSLIIERVITNSWWTNSSKITDGTNYYVKVKAYLENDVYSVYTTYCDANANPILITRLAPINVTMNSYTESEENFITFDFPSSGITPGFNIQYKTSINGSYKYVYVTDPNYNEIVQYSNNKAIINISKISDNIELMYYQLQVVPMGLTNYFKSNWSSTWEFSIPNMIDDIYYDAENIEYYWVHKGSNSYIIKDEVLDVNDNVIATYKYNMKSNSYTSEAYYKEREVMIDDILTTVGTVAYMPSIPGYKHRISVAVSLDSHAEYSLMSLFKPCDTVNLFNLFSVEKDILQSGSELYQSMNPAIVSGLLKNNAYGSESNSYLIKNTTDFTNINKRLNRYNYTHTYIVELCYVVNGNGQEVEMTLNIEEDIPNYCFKQTVNLSGITAGIGKYQTSTGGTLSYKNFNNTYDGNGKTISYNIKATTTNLSLGLFLKLDANAVVKNLKVNAIIDFNAIQNSTFTYGAVAGENNGNVYNCQVLSISVLNLISGTNSGVKNLTFGGAIGENKGTIELCILNNITLTLQLANNEEALYVGGIAGKNTGGVIKNSGNNAKIQVTSKKTVYVGGIAGSSSGNVQQVYNKGTILVTMNSGSGQIGGLIGFNNTSGKVANSYNTGSVNIAGSGSPTINLGGLVGYTLSSDITNSYSTLAAVQNSGNIKAGTLVGLIEITIPAGFQLSNYYINDAAVGNYSGSIDVFAKKLTVNELKVYALNLNNAAGGDPIFKNTSTSPCFVWE